MLRSAAIGLLFLCFSTALHAAEPPRDSLGPARHVSVIPGERYGAGWFHRLLLGSHWRDLWTQSFDVPVLDLGSFAGGLTPTKEGQGRETRSLRFLGMDGTEYKFRSIDKDPRNALPPDLQESIAADVLQDQISSSNPLAAAIVSPLLDAAGVLHAAPRIALLPDDGRLGEFRQKFAGVLGTIEPVPAESSAAISGLGTAGKIIGTVSLFERIDKNAGEHVDAREYLKARLMDLYIGDWDRHQDQWRWAGFKAEDGWIWRPIPRDRDQAFCRLDGFIPWLATQYVKEVKGFGDDYPDIESLTWTARTLDRRLLAPLARPAWDSVVASIVEKLTDSVITSAAHELPPGMYAAEGPALERSLKLRREQLPLEADRFYRLCARFPEVHGTDKADVAEISEPDPHDVRVSLYRRDKRTGEKKGDAWYDRVFPDSVTAEVRLFLQDGDDLATITGDGRSGIRIVIDGGDGRDELVDHSGMPAALYDHGAKSTFTEGGRTTIDREKFERQFSDTLGFVPLYPDYGHEWVFFPRVGYDPDAGLMLGGRETLTDYAFRAEPYNTLMTLEANYATKVRRGQALWRFESMTLVKHIRSSFTLSASQIDRLNFYGFGNQTVSDPSRHDAGDYRIRQEHYAAAVAADIPVSRSVSGRLGLSIRHVRNDAAVNTLVSELHPYGSEPSRTFAGIESGIRYDSRDRLLAPSGGILATLEGWYVPVVLDNVRGYGKVRADARAYLSAGGGEWMTLALRIAGEKLFGTYPFFESAFIGGAGSIRGFEKERFAGDASLIGNSELRLALGNFSILLPGRYGLFLIGEGGRVMLAGESSTAWHGAAGGGVWLTALRNTFGAGVSVVRSSELTGVYFTSGFMF